MGLRNPLCVLAKADGRQWIYPREQIRMSHQLRRIISGEKTGNELARRMRCSKRGARGAEVIAVSIRRNPWPRIPSVTRRRSFVTSSSRRCAPTNMPVGLDRHHSTAQDYDRLGHR
jgi:hypothetical protein